MQKTCPDKQDECQASLDGIWTCLGVGSRSDKVSGAAKKALNEAEHAIDATQELKNRTDSMQASKLQCSLWLKCRNRQNDNSAVHDDTRVKACGAGRKLGLKDT